MGHHRPLESGRNTFHELHDEFRNTQPFEHLVHQLLVCKHASATMDARYWQFHPDDTHIVASDQKSQHSGRDANHISENLDTKLTDSHNRPTTDHHKRGAPDL